MQEMQEMREKIFGSVCLWCSDRVQQEQKSRLISPVGDFCSGCSWMVSPGDVVNFDGYPFRWRTGGKLEKLESHRRRSG